MRYLITGGAGFVGASLAVRLKRKYPSLRILSLDNLKRRGSELNLPLLKRHGIAFAHGDIRNREDLDEVGPVDVIVECSAEPSVMAGYRSAPDYLINTNLTGTVNCLELARQHQARFVFLSTSRVYPFKTIDALKYSESKTRFEMDRDQKVAGCSPAGIAEDFPLTGARSLYGTTKLASELLVEEYADMYGIDTVINRCGVIAGPGQFGKVDQGFVVLWAARHFWNQELSYMGYGGEGKQVRDVLHIDDFFRLIDIQVNDFGRVRGSVFNVGGGRERSVSLKELTKICRKLTGNSPAIRKIRENRPADIRFFLTDHAKVTKATGWKPEISVERTVEDVVEWIKNDAVRLEGILR